MRIRVPRGDGQPEQILHFERRGDQLLIGVEDQNGLNFQDVRPAIETAKRIVTTTTAAVAGAAGFAALTAVGCPPPLAAGAVAGARSLVNVDGYYRDDGTYVREHNRTPPDEHEWNNFS